MTKNAAQILADVLKYFVPAKKGENEAKTLAKHYEELKKQTQEAAP